MEGSLLEEQNEEEEENIINVPFVDREYANMNKYTMKQPYGIFDIKIPKDEIIDYEIKEITDDDFGGRIYLNKVWEAKL